MQAPTTFSDPSMISVTIDIAGMYYQRTVEIASGSTIQDAMNAAVTSGSMDGGPTLKFTTEADDLGHLFIDGIRVMHASPAVSRQNKARAYPAGVYEYYDDSVVILADGSFGPKDPCRPYALTWQYYVYDDKGVDSERVNGKTDRVVKAFSKRTLDKNSLIVWRLVAIFLKPTYGDSLKVAKAKLGSAYG